MIQLANKIDRDVLSTVLQGLTSRSAPTERPFRPGPSSALARSASMNRPFRTTASVPRSSRRPTPIRSWAQTGLYVQDAAKSAYREAQLGKIAGIDTYKTQNVASWTTGARGGTPLVNGNAQAVTYGSTNSWGSSQTLNIKGGSNSITGWAKLAIRSRLRTCTRSTP